MVDEPLPPEFQFGKVVGRVIRAIADTAEDVDALPQARPASGTVTFTPRQSLRIITTPGDKTFVTAAAETANLSAAGRIIDAEGRQGIWLVTGVYDVKFDLSDGMGLPSMVIEVTTDHTDDAPLDLVDDASYVPPPRTPVQTLLVPVGGADGYVLTRSGTELAWTPPPSTTPAPDATTSAKGIVQLAGDLSGTAAAPTVPGLATRPDTAAVQASIDAAIANLIAGAPGTLDTLNEIATQLGSDETAAGALTTLVTAIRNLTDSTHVTALSGAYVDRWLASHSYLANALVLAPDGSIIQRNANGTSRSTYDTTEQAAWTVKASGTADTPTTNNAVIFVDPTYGDDSNTGTLKSRPKATLASAFSLAASGFTNAVAIEMSRGVHNVSLTLITPQGIKLRGAGCLPGQETEVVWTGADDGSYVIRTASNTSGSDWTFGAMSGFLVRPNSSKPGGGAYTNLNGIDCRNIQNGSRIVDVQVKNFPGVGIKADWQNAGVPADGFPGYVTFERVWATGCNVDWHVYGGFTSVLFNMCAGDVSSNTTDVFILDGRTGGTLGGRGANYIFIGFKTEDNGTPTGAGADPNYFTINADFAVSFIGCSGKKGSPGASGVKPWINYTATPSSQNAVAGGIPLALINCHTSNLPVVVKGPDGANWLAPTVGTGGQSMQVNQWLGQSQAPKKWTGTHSGFVADGASIAGTDPTAATMIAESAPAASVTPFEWRAPVFTHRFTAADSTSVVPTPDTGSAGTAEVGTWGIASNKLYLSTLTHNASYGWAGVGAEGSLHADITLSSGQGFPGLQFRKIDATNGLILAYKQRTGELILYKRAGAGPAALKAQSYAWTPGAAKHVKVTMKGAVITAYVDGQQVLTWTLTGGDETTYGTATGIGVFQPSNLTSDANADDGGSRYDNLSYVASTVRITTAGVLQENIGGTWTDVSTGSVAGALLAANNLSDLISAATARTNLGLGTAATHPATDFDASGSAAAVAAASLQQSANLSDLLSAVTARSNLGLGTAAVVNTGTGAGNAILGNDSRLTDSRTPTSHASTHSRGGSDPLVAADIGAAPGRLGTASSIRSETVPRWGLTSGILSAGVVYLARIALKNGSYTTVTSACTSAGVGLANAFFGLYDVTSLALLATSSSAVTALQTAVGAGTDPPTVTMNYTATEGDYYMAVLVGSGTTLPTMVISGLGAGAVASRLDPPIAQRHNTTGQTSLPSTAVLMTSVSGIILPWLRYE